MLKPSAPLAVTIVVPTPRTSLNAAESKVPTFLRNLTSCPPVMVSLTGGGVKSTRLRVQFGPPWHSWQLAAAKSARPCAISGSGAPPPTLVARSGEIGARIPIAT